MGMFDDLIPGGGGGPTPQPQLMQGAQQPLPPQRMPNLMAATQSPQQAQPAPQQAPQQGLFDDLIPKRDTPTMDVLKSGAAGIGRGLIGIPGMAGDLTSLATGGKYGGGWGSDAIQKKVEQYTGPFHQPQTTAGQYAETAGSFLPAMAIPGGEMSLGARFLRTVAAPALASEAAGQLTKGTAAEPYARAGAAVLGGGLGMGLASREAMPALQGAEQLGKSAENVYQGPLQGLNFKPSSVDDMQDYMRQSLGSRDASIANGTHAIINSLDTPSVSADPMSALTGVTPKQPAPVPWSDVHSARMLLGQQAGKFADPIDAGAAVTAKKAMDDWLRGATQSDLASGDISELKNFFTANTNYQVMSALDMLEGKQYSAELGAAAANSGANFENAMRQRIKGILVSPSQRQQFESLPNGNLVIQAMEKVVRGGTTDNLVRALSNLTGGGGGMHAGWTIGAGLMTGHPEVALAPLAGWGLKAARNKSINSQLGNITNLIAKQAPANAQINQQRAAIAARPNPGLDYQRALLNAALSQPRIPQQP